MRFRSGGFWTVGATPDGFENNSGPSKACGSGQTLKRVQGAKALGITGKRSEAYFLTDQRGDLLWKWKLDSMGALAAKSFTVTFGNVERKSHPKPPDQVELDLCPMDIHRPGFFGPILSFLRQ